MANSNANTGLTQAIRLVLQAAGTPLVVAEILEALPARLQATTSNVAAICGQRSKAGEFTAEMRGSKVEYGLNHAWRAPVVKPSGPRGAATVGAAADRLPPAAAPRPQATLVIPHNLVERLASISVDIEDALGDACDAQLPHELIKGLVVANGAIARAAKSIGA